MNHKYLYNFIFFTFFTLAIGYIGFSFGVWSVEKQKALRVSEINSEINKVKGLENKKDNGNTLYVLGSKKAQGLDDFAPFWKTWNVLSEKYSPVSTSTEDVIDNHEKVISSIKGLVSSYNDPYTVFFAEKENDNFKESIYGEFEGIGAHLGVAQGMLAVAGLIDGAPAERDGLMSNDIIIAIDGQSIEGLTMPEAIQKIRGARDTQVILTVWRHEEKNPIDIEITRGKVAIPSTAVAIASKVKDSVNNVLQRIKEKIIPGSQQEKDIPDELQAEDFFVFKLASFSKTSKEAFLKEIEEFKKSNTMNLIIDLRDNQGGYMDSAIDIASHFLPQGAVVVTEKIGASQIERVDVSRGYDTLKDFKDLHLVILVNRNTASAAEVLAGALKEHGVATIVGEKTFGKGSVQELIDITDNMSLKVTVARWYTPNGNSISKNGLIPDELVELTEENTKNGQDVIFERALEVLIGGK